MVVDTSAIIAIIATEPESSRFLDTLLRAQARLMSALTALEAAMVIEGRYGPDAGADFDLLVYTAESRLCPSTSGRPKLPGWLGADSGRVITPRDSI